MEIKIRQKDLCRGINIVEKIIPASVLGILRGILITAEEGTVKLASRNNDLSIETELEAEVIEVGKIVIDAKVLSSIINKINDEYIEITSLENQRVQVKCKNIDIKLPFLEANEFNPVPHVNVNKSNIITIEEKNLSKMINHISFAISKIEDRTMNKDCALLEFKDNKFIMVAVDGYRVAVYDHLPNNRIDINARAIIIGKSIYELKKLLSSNSEGNVKIVFDERVVLFVIDKTKIFTSILCGNFTDHELIFSEPYDTQIKLKRKEILEALELASVFSEPAVRLYIKKDMIVISANSYIGEIKEIIYVDIGIEEIKISFNVNYLIEILRVIDEDEIIISFPDSKKNYAVISYDERKTKDKYKYLVFAMILRD